MSVVIRVEAKINILVDNLVLYCLVHFVGDVLLMIMQNESKHRC